VNRFLTIEKNLSFEEFDDLLLQESNLQIFRLENIKEDSSKINYLKDLDDKNFLSFKEKILLEENLHKLSSNILKSSNEKELKKVKGKNKKISNKTISENKKNLQKNNLKLTSDSIEEKGEE